MVRLRLALGRIAIAWCLCQLAGMTAASTILFALGAEALECTCAHGDHAFCPMHHPRTGTRRCAMSAADDAPSAALASLFGLTQLVIPSTIAVVAESTRVSIPLHSTSLLFRPVPPPLRPPRV
jgi:hypothetical protein